MQFHFHLGRIGFTYRRFDPANMSVIEEAESESARTARRDRRRRIDVTELDARGVREFVEHNVGTDRVSLEQRGARTYLVVGER